MNGAALSFALAGRDPEQGGDAARKDVYLCVEMDTIMRWLLGILKLNDEHQGEGGTLVFVEANITTI